MTRPPLWSLAALVVTVAGIAALARGAVPQAAASGGATSNSPPIVVSDAYVREPASPTVAAAYFTIYNTTGSPDTLQSAESGAGRYSVLHTETTGGGMTVTAAGVIIPAHGSVTFKPTTGHLMIENLYGTLTPGQTVDLELDFMKAGPVIVEAPVIGIYANPPSGPAATGAPSSPSQSSPSQSSPSQSSPSRPVPPTASPGVPS
jgi:copper(I)-binding protein